MQPIGSPINSNLEADVPETQDTTRTVKNAICSVIRINLSGHIGEYDKKFKFNSNAYWRGLSVNVIIIVFIGIVRCGWR